MDPDAGGSRHEVRGGGVRIQRIREEPDVNDVAMNTSHHTEAFYHRLVVTTAVTEDGLAPGLHRCDMRLRVRS